MAAPGSGRPKQRPAPSYNLYEDVELLIIEAIRSVKEFGSRSGGKGFGNVYANLGHELRQIANEMSKIEAEVRHHKTPEKDAADLLADRELRRKAIRADRKRLACIFALTTMTKLVNHAVRVSYQRSFFGVENSGMPGYRGLGDDRRPHKMRLAPDVIARLDRISGGKKRQRGPLVRHAVKEFVPLLYAEMHVLESAYPENSKLRQMRRNGELWWSDDDADPDDSDPRGQK